MFYGTNYPLIYNIKFRPLKFKCRNTRYVGLCILRIYTARTRSSSRDSRRSCIFPWTSILIFTPWHVASTFRFFVPPAFPLRFIFRDAKTTSDILMRAFIYVSTYSVVCNPRIDAKCYTDARRAFLKKERNMPKNVVTGWHNAEKMIVSRLCMALCPFASNYRYAYIGKHSEDIKYTWLQGCQIFNIYNICRIYKIVKR